MTIAEPPSDSVRRKTSDQAQPGSARASFRVWLLTGTCLGVDGILLCVNSYLDNRPTLYPYEYLAMQATYYGVLLVAPLAWFAWAAFWSQGIAAPALDAIHRKSPRYLEALWLFPSLAATFVWYYALSSILSNVSGLNAYRYPPAFFINAVILCPFFEEMVFRRLLFRYLTSRMSLLKAALLSSLVFALAHFGSYHPLPWGQFLSGLFLCGLYYWRKSLVAPIAAHMGGNLALAIIRMFFLP